jgi:putative tryptophan/tyrosine transport system substrate-binding protein
LKCRSAAVSRRTEVCYPFGRKHGKSWAVKRRDFITLLGAAATWPLAARAQQPPWMPMIGFLHPGSAEPNATLLAAFRKGLAETGYAEGKNIAIEFRWAHGESSRLGELAADLVQRRVAVIVTPIGTTTALAAKAATSTIPIVFSAGTDPVKAGIVASLRRPGANVTGVNYMAAELSAKRLSLLHDLAPSAARIALLVDPTNPVATQSIIEDTQAAAGALGRHIDVFRAENSREIETAFAALAQNRADALLVGAEPFFIDRRVQIVTLAGARPCDPRRRSVYDRHHYAEEKAQALEQLAALVETIVNPPAGANVVPLRA